MCVFIIIIVIKFGKILNLDEIFYYTYSSYSSNFSLYIGVDEVVLE